VDSEWDYSLMSVRGHKKPQRGAAEEEEHERPTFNRRRMDSWPIISSTIDGLEYSDTRASRQVRGQMCCLDSARYGRVPHAFSRSRLEAHLVYIDIIIY